MSARYDIVIIGAGAAGLAIAAALAHPARRIRMLVLEPRAISPNPRRWVFPAEPGHALSRFADARFESFELTAPDGAARKRSLRRVRLHHVRASDVQGASLDAVAASPSADLEQGVRIDAIAPEGRGLRIETSLGSVFTRQAVDTRPQGGGFVGAHSWTQIVHAALVPAGGAARAGEPGLRLGPASAVRGGVEFVQTLVLPDAEALLEAVCLCAPGEDAPHLEERLFAMLEAVGADKAAARRWRAVLPLTLQPAPRSRWPQLVHAPAGASGLRFGPGAEALRLTRWAAGAAGRFAAGGRITPPPPPSAAARAAASLTLGRLTRAPQESAFWLNDILARLPADAALQFLAGTPGWRAVLAGLAHTRQSA